jgi:hypothetical protein
MRTRVRDCVDSYRLCWGEIAVEEASESITSAVRLALLRKAMIGLSDVGESQTDHMDDKFSFRGYSPLAVKLSDLEDN